MLNAMIRKDKYDVMLIEWISNPESVFPLMNVFVDDSCLSSPLIIPVDASGGWGTGSPELCRGNLLGLGIPQVRYLPSIH